jgi:glycolate oxidase FAD binding subunit
VITPAGSVKDIQEIVRNAPPGARLLPVAGATKPALSDLGAAGVERIDLSGLSGIVEYDPAELTITALAGTPVSEVQAVLAEHGQYLPCDPPLTDAGATLGGTVATGAAGPSALRYGGVRDFVIGVRFVDGTGRLVAGGGKVVKNAAGFDLPKLLIGSIGRLGVMVSLSFKVFPQPAATTTMEFLTEDLATAVDALIRLRRSPVELDALDITPTGRVLARVGGRAETLDARATRLAGAVGDRTHMRHDGPDERTLWAEASELAWRRDEQAVVRVGLSLAQIPALDQAIHTAAPQATVRYSLGGTAAWIGWPPDAGLDRLDAVLDAERLPGMTLLRGPAHGDQVLLGPHSGGVFATRVKSALDPDGRFLEL